jgi:hypothetical protein
MGELTVAGKPVHGAPIRCVHGATVPVAVRQEFTKPDPNEAIVSAANASQPQPEGAPAADGKAAPQNVVITALRAVDVFLAPKDGSGESGFASSQQEEPGKEGTTLQNVPPGRYKVLANARRGYVASITANGLNLMQEPLVVEAGAAAPAIEIVLRDDSATITGSISGAAAKEAASPFPLLVWAFPVDDGDAARPSAGSEEPNGKFTIPNVVPGRYLVLAFSGQAANLEYRNKDVMKAYEPNGVIVSLLPGQTLDVALKAAITYVDWAVPEEED